MFTHTPSLESRFAGCLLGLTLGDALGAPVEGMPTMAIIYAFGTVRDYLANPPVATLEYTDDTQMMIGVAEVLIEKGSIDPDNLMQHFAENFDPGRGYGQGARRVLETARSGGDWKRLAESQFPGGSFGNGAAMRVAPIGIFFHEDYDRVAEQAQLSSLPTHTHPIGIDGARLVALAVAYVVRNPGFTRAELFGFLESRAETDEFRKQMARAAVMSADSSPAIFGSSLPADRSVTTAIASFALSPKAYLGGITSAIAMGDDTDTLAAMAGALAGAHLGVEALPEHLLNRLEDGPKGREYICNLARQLAAAREKRGNP
jgi:poly(ADP-ribose) glycohydrolase ARH3